MSSLTNTEFNSPLQMIPPFQTFAEGISSSKFSESVRRVAKPVCHQREIERRRMKDQLEDRLQRVEVENQRPLRVLEAIYPHPFAIPPRHVIGTSMFWVVAIASGLLGLAINFTSMWFLNQTGPTTYRSCGVVGHNQDFTL